jgi:hypothetical protein
MLTFGVVLLHDNVPSYTATRTQSLLERFNLEIFDHRPYRPYFAPSDYHLFTYMKNWLRLQCFNNNEELMDYVKNVAGLIGGRLDTGMQKLIPQYDMCLSYSGDYVEKWLKYVCIFCV